MKLHTIRRYLLDIPFPNRCPFCDRVIPWNAYVCSSCGIALPLAEGICEACGKEVCICGAGIYYDQCIAVCFYEGIATQAVLRMKYGNCPDHAEGMGYLMAQRLLDRGGQYDMLLPVPMTKQKQRARGYNQADLLAKAISRHTGIPNYNHVFCKRKHTAEQHTLSKQQRQENLSNAFQVVQPRFVSGKSILLCDDVLTTGNTLSECARILKICGAATVSAIVFVTTKMTAKCNQENIT